MCGKRIPMMLNCFVIDKLYGFMMHSVMLAVGCIWNVGSYVTIQQNIDWLSPFVQYGSSQMDKLCKAIAHSTNEWSCKDNHCPALSTYNIVHDLWTPLTTLFQSHILNCFISTPV